MELGFTPREIERRTEVGRLQIPPSWDLSPRPDPVSPHSRDRGRPRLLASGGPQPALGRWPLGLVPYRVDAGLVHVSVAGRNPGRHPGIRVHRTTSLRHSELTVRHGIPVTTPARTLLDLAGELRDRELERALAEAFALRLTDRIGMLTLISRHRGRRGATTLRRRLDEARPARTRSEAEELLLSLVRAAGLPEPQVTARLGPWEVDFLWSDRYLAVEVDGYASHSSPWAFERDHAKDAELRDAGYVLLRFTWRQLREQPERTVARIRGAL